jgi:carboxypeptidase A4
MKLLTLSFALGLASAASVATKVDYTGWRVYRVNVADNAKFSKIVSDIGLATWKGKPATSKVVDVMVSPSQLNAFEQASKELQTKLMHDNLGEAIEAEADFPVYTGNYISERHSYQPGTKTDSATSRYTTSSPNGDVSIAAAPNATWFNNYHAIADHMQFIRDLAAAYPSNSEVISAGSSNGGRDIAGIHIWGSGGKGSKIGVVWHGTVHAREWITTMVRHSVCTPH